MTLAYWHKEYSTGNSLIDYQHQRLFTIVNTLHDAMMQGRGKDVMQKTLEELIKYTVEHFATEEKLMLENDYPNYKEHKRKHDELATKVLSLAEEYREGNILLNVEILHFLSEWLVHHIKGEDLNMINLMRKINDLPVSNHKNQDYNKQAIANIQETQALIKQMRESLKK